MRICLYLGSVAMLAASTLLSQQGTDSRADYQLRGELSRPTSAGEMLTAELTGTQAGPPQRTPIDPSGTFEFYSVQPGWHMLRIVSPDGAVLHQENVLVNSASQLVSVQIPDRVSNPIRRNDGTVSVQQLSHKVPAQARKAFDKGERAATKGEHQDAARFFREAVAIDPQFADAFSELGVEEAAEGDFEHAIEEFQKAVDIVPEHMQALANLSIDLCKLHRYHEAALAARRALQVNPASGTLHYVLAVSLLADKGDSDEVLDHLERSCTDMPHAQLVAASLLAKRGKRTEAIEHAEAFLRTAPADDKDRPRAEALLAQLRQ